jgi:hypothetical protein
MRFPGYWVFGGADRVFVREAVFDETELDPATQWKEAVVNQDPSFGARGFVEGPAAFAWALELMKGASPSQSNEAGEGVHVFESAEALKQFFESRSSG